MVKRLRPAGWSGIALWRLDSTGIIDTPVPNLRSLETELTDETKKSSMNAVVDGLLWYRCTILPVTFEM